MNTRLMAVAIALAAATPLAAQSAKASRCPAIDTTARWYVKQRAWADDSRHAWSNDSLRTVLVHAAALDAHPDAGAGALLGYEIVGAAPNAPSSDAAPAIAMLRGLAQNRQATWPTKSVVGAAGVRAVWTLAKTFVLSFLVIWLRVSYPRLREDQLQRLAWQGLVPVALAQLALTGVVAVAL